MVNDNFIDPAAYTIVDGVSARQLNGFDCGVFAMANIERYALDATTPIGQSTMKLYRSRYLSQMYELGLAMGVI